MSSCAVRNFEYNLKLYPLLYSSCASMTFSLLELFYCVCVIGSRSCQSIRRDVHYGIQLPEIHKVALECLGNVLECSINSVFSHCLDISVPTIFLSINRKLNLPPYAYVGEWVSTCGCVSEGDVTLDEYHASLTICKKCFQYEYLRYLYEL